MSCPRWDLWPDLCRRRKDTRQRHSLPGVLTTAGPCRGSQLDQPRHIWKHWNVPTFVELIWGNMNKIYLYFISFTGTDMAQVVEILPRGSQGLLYVAQSITWLLMRWRLLLIYIPRHISVSALKLIEAWQKWSTFCGKDSHMKIFNESLYISFVPKEWIDKSKLFRQFLNTK